MKKILLSLIITLASAYAHAEWECKLTCLESDTQILLSIDQHASGQAYSDLIAECRALGGGFSQSPCSGCPSTCQKFVQTTSVYYGSGGTMTQARENARSSCNDTATNVCGALNSKRPQNYDCKQN